MNRPIGFFDSGVGGLSVLREAIHLLPQEDYIYFGDSVNAPYGMRTAEEVQELTLKAINFLQKKNVKAIVIACNTATAMAIDNIRANKADDLIIVGIEPSVKPAAELVRKGKILVMATSGTLASEKFASLVKKHAYVVEVMPLACPGLVELIEMGEVQGERIETFLHKLFKDVDLSGVGSIVLGCTHYPFVKSTIRKIIGNKIPILDGSHGTVNHLKYLLSEENLLRAEQHRGEITILNSLPKQQIFDLCFKLLNIKEHKNVKLSSL